MLTLDTIRTASDLDLLTAVLGHRKTAESVLRHAKGSLFRLLHQSPSSTGDLFCSDPQSDYAGNPHARLHAARELVARSIHEEFSRGDAMTSPHAVRDYLRLLLAGRDYEVFLVLYLDAGHRVIATQEAFRGTLTQTAVYPREIVKAALQVNAAAVIFSHNHPSGTAQPSQADELLTRTLKDALAMVDVRVLDHFIVADTKTISFAERGLL